MVILLMMGKRMSVEPQRRKRKPTPIRTPLNRADILCHLVQLVGILNTVDREHEHGHLIKLVKPQ